MAPRTSFRSKVLLAAAFGGLLLPLPLLCLGQERDADAPAGVNMLQPPRWPVMTGTDPGVLRISPKPVAATLAALGNLPRPQELSGVGKPLVRYRAVRLGPGEKTLWSVDARIVETQHDRDGDYHLTLRSASGQTMACELPDPKRMVSPSPFARQMTQARAALAARLHPKDTPQACDAAAQITGLGYYGRVKPGAGLPNGLQLHPVVSLVFLK